MSAPGCNQSTREANCRCPAGGKEPRPEEWAMSLMLTYLRNAQVRAHGSIARSRHIGGRRVWLLTSAAFRAAQRVGRGAAGGMDIVGTIATRPSGDPARCGRQVDDSPVMIGVVAPRVGRSSNHSRPTIRRDRDAIRNSRKRAPSVTTAA